MSAKDREARLVKRAKEIAKSGRHVGWWYVAFELKHQHGEPMATELLDKEPIRAELDRICETAMKQKREARNA